jgi:hypothetical protein
VIGEPAGQFGTVGGAPLAELPRVPAPDDLEPCAGRRALRTLVEARQGLLQARRLVPEHLVVVGLATAHHVQVRIVESRHDRPAIQVHHHGPRSGERRDLTRRTHADHAPVAYRERLGEARSAPDAGALVDGATAQHQVRLTPVTLHTEPGHPVLVRAAGHRAPFAAHLRGI